MCQDCDRIEDQRKEANRQEWNRLFDLACKATYIRVLVSVLSFPENGGPLYVETQNHTDILDRIVKADHDSYCPDYTDDLEASGTLYIG